MTEDIFFCYNAKEAPEKDKRKTDVNPSRKIRNQNNICSQVLFVDRDRAKVNSLIFLFRQKHFINQNTE